MDFVFDSRMMPKLFWWTFITNNLTAAWDTSAKSSHHLLHSLLHWHHKSDLLSSSSDLHFWLITALLMNTKAVLTTNTVLKQPRQLYSQGNHLPFSEANFFPNLYRWLWFCEESLDPETSRQENQKLLNGTSTICDGLHAVQFLRLCVLLPLLKPIGSRCVMSASHLCCIFWMSLCT